MKRLSASFSGSFAETERDLRVLVRRNLPAQLADGDNVAQFGNTEISKIVCERVGLYRLIHLSWRICEEHVWRGRRTAEFEFVGSADAEGRDVNFMGSFLIDRDTGAFFKFFLHEVGANST